MYYGGQWSHSYTGMSGQIPFTGISPRGDPSAGMVPAPFYQPGMLCYQQTHVLPPLDDSLKQGTDKPFQPLYSSQYTYSNKPLEEEKKREPVPMECGQFFNLNEIIARGIVGSKYFKKLRRCNDFDSIVNEIYKEVRNLLPAATETRVRMPSKAFILLYKLFLLQLTASEIKSLISNQDSPYIRGIGFLYLRFVISVRKLNDWFIPYCDDPAKLSPGGGTEERITIGEFSQKLITENLYCGLALRRIPLPILKDFRQAVEKKTTEKLLYQPTIDDLTIGKKVRAEYWKDSKYYNATVDKILKDGDVLVTFTDYGNQEKVKVKDIILLEKRKRVNSRRRSRSRSRGRRRQRRSKSQSTDKSDGSDSDEPPPAPLNPRQQRLNRRRERVMEQTGLDWSSVNKNWGSAGWGNSKNAENKDSDKMKFPPTRLRNKKHKISKLNNSSDSKSPPKKEEKKEEVSHSPSPFGYKPSALATDARQRLSKLRAIYGNSKVKKPLGVDDYVTTKKTVPKNRKRQGIGEEDVLRLGFSSR